MEERAVCLQGRMKSRLGKRNVRLRGLGGPAVYGVPGACASATRLAARPALAATVREGGLREVPAAISIAPGADDAIPAKIHDRPGSPRESRGVRLRGGAG